MVPEINFDSCQGIDREHQWTFGAAFPNIAVCRRNVAECPVRGGGFVGRLTRKLFNQSRGGLESVTALFFSTAQLRARNSAGRQPSSTAAPARHRPWHG